MSRGDAPRILILGPIGLQPWITRTELVEQITALGYDAYDNDVRAVVPAPDPLPARLGRVAASVPVLAGWSARMLWRWRRRARAGLRENRIDRVLVWDPVWAALVCAIRPRGVEVVWAWDGTVGERLDQRLLQRWLRHTSDRWVAAAGFEPAQWSARVLG